MRAQTEKEETKSAPADSVDENSELLDTLSDIMETQLGISKSDQFLLILTLAILQLHIGVLFGLSSLRG